MKNIKLLNKIAKVGTDVFDAGYNVGEAVEDPAGIMVRSAALHDMQFPKSLLAIARAGAGVNNIPVDRCTEEGIVVFNTPGANANGVKELAVCALVLAARDVIGGAAWAEGLRGQEGVAKLVESGKSAFAGTELLGKKLGVVGLGAIGGMVANAADALGMKVVGYDPYLSPEAAARLNATVALASGYEQIFESCDYITLHVPATATTKNMICEASLSKMKDGVRIINLARADLVNAEDMKAAIAAGKVAKYVVDFPTEATLGVKGIVNIPHLGASTAEAEDNCAVMAAKQLKEYLECGNIKNSVNFPNVSLARGTENRVCVTYKNAPETLSKITAALCDVAAMASGSRGDIAYAILDTAGAADEKALAEIAKIEGVLAVRSF